MHHLTAIYYAFVILAVGWIAIGIGTLDTILVRLFGMEGLDMPTIDRGAAVITAAIAIYVLLAGLLTAATPEPGHRDEEA